MDKASKLPDLWQSPPKVHSCIVADIASRMLSTWTFEMIYDEVVKWGLEDDDDILATTRALRVIRDHRRTYQD